MSRISIHQKNKEKEDPSRCVSTSAGLDTANNTFCSNKSTYYKLFSTNSKVSEHVKNLLKFID